ncbi:MAG TPA: MBL fold metallo-hydrolase [Dehalococcoidia bacterium]|nr:MBL fold metallo-hydrolase [Dehalococcoidia bacterium]
MATVDILLPGYSFGTDSGTPAFCAVLLVESEGRRILVDTAHVGRRTSLQTALQARGLTEGDIDLVFMTHAHWDHVQNFDLFPDAPLLLHPAERKYAAKPHVNDWATPQWTGAAVETHRIQEVSEGDELAVGVAVIDLPGHSPGSMGLLVETEHGISGLTGDAMHTANVGLTGKSPLVFYSSSQANESIGKIMSASDVLFPGHDRPFRMKDGEADYLEPFTLTLSNLSPDREGLSFTTPEPSIWIMPGAKD